LRYVQLIEISEVPFETIHDCLQVVWESEPRAIMWPNV